MKNAVWCRLLLALALLLRASLLPAADPTAVNGNRLVHLHSPDPFYPDQHLAKLITPQWVGESGVDAVVILAVDDMRDPAKYEKFLRPVLERLKRVDGRAPVSIMANAVTPTDPLLPAWLKEGLSVEVHTLTHPCPLLRQGSFPTAVRNYHDCVDLLNLIPGNHPVAFRMPCCDSLNTPSPRFYAEIFRHNSAAGKFLTIDSSVMMRFTPDDPELPREAVLDAAGQPRFTKYFPTATNAVTRKSLASFATYIENYPYPYVLNQTGWEFPAMVPSDWEAFNTHGATNAVTVADWKAALDCTVKKQGVFTFVFHPHGWIRNDQLVEFIDYATSTYGKRVKFLTFREAQERLNRHLLAGVPLRTQQGDNGVRLMDLNGDGYMDVVIGNAEKRLTRLWEPQSGQWRELPFPGLLVRTSPDHSTHDAGARFGVVQDNGFASCFSRYGTNAFWHFTGAGWSNDVVMLQGLELAGRRIQGADDVGNDLGVQFRDMDHDGHCELIVGNDVQRGVLEWRAGEHLWKLVPGAWPVNTALVKGEGHDNGLRFVDVNGDGYDDVFQSNEDGYQLSLYIAVPKPHLGWAKGWSFSQRHALAAEAEGLPLIARNEKEHNNGVWFRNGFMWVQNEDTAKLPDLVDRRSFAELMLGDQPKPKSPAEARAAFDIKRGFNVELVASEPLVMDPVAFDWGADGRLWVVEMADYPLGMDGKGKPGGRVVCLTDTDGNGRYDKRTVFLDGLNFPNGIMAWRKGVLISAAPDIIYAEDTDGDGKADVRKVLFTGFREGNQQHRVNGFVYGLDNWVYAANGDSGGVIRSVATGQSLDIRGYDIRFRPDTGEIEPVPGQTQFSRQRDDWGNWFGNNNPTWLWHYHLPVHYLKRNPFLKVKATRNVTVDYTPPNQVMAVSRQLQRFNWADRVFEVTSAASASPYRGVLFGPDYASSVFISEPANNVVHREVLEPAGVTFHSHRGLDELDREFLSSHDNWFRPTMLKTGPDDALYIADMYRLILEHPEYFPEELKNRPDLRAGDDKGRIWRVAPIGKTLRMTPDLSKLDGVELAKALNSLNGWQRDTVQRLLVERQDQSVVPALIGLAQSASDARVRLQAFATLQGLGALTSELLEGALRDAHPAVRKHAVEWCEPLLNDRPELAKAVAALVDDSNARVRYQLAFSLGEWKSPVAGRALAELALTDFGDPDLQTAILSSALPHLSTMLDTLLVRRVPPSSSLSEALLRLAAATDDRAALARGVELLSHPAVSLAVPRIRFSGLAGLLDGLELRNSSYAKVIAAGGEGQKLLARLAPVFVQAREAAGNVQLDEKTRLAAVRLLGRGPDATKEDYELLAGLLQPRDSVALQEAALNGLKHSGSPDAAKLLLAGWKGYGPSTRTEVLNQLTGRGEWALLLLSALSDGRLTASEISPAHRQKLLKHAQQEVRERASQIFATTNADRQQVVQKYARVMELDGNPARGAEIFKQNCSVCHRFKDVGNAVGPDLGSVADKSAASLLTAILDPNQAVDAGYTAYTIETRGGQEFTGIMTAETPNSVTLKLPGGTEETVLRSDIQRLSSGGLSLMPEGLEAVLPPQAMADLLAHLLR